MSGRVQARAARVFCAALFLVASDAAGPGRLNAAGVIIIQEQLTSSTPIVRGSGHQASEDRAARPVRQIEVAGSIELVFRQAATPAIRVTADDNILPLIATEIADDVLRVHPSGSFSTAKGVLVEIAMPGLRALSSAGSGAIEIRDVDGEELRLDIAGSSHARASGNVGRVDIEVSGSRDVAAVDLRSGAATITISGSGSVAAAVAHSVYAGVIGSGDIRITGDPPQRDVRVKGSGRILFGA